MTKQELKELLTPEFLSTLHTAVECCGWDVVSWEAFQKGYEAAQPKAVPVEEPSKPRSPLDEIVDRMVKKHQAQKLYNRLYDELGYSIDCCDEIVDLVEKWLPKEQSFAGSQNLDTELLVEGFNDAIRKMKEMLR